MHLIFSEDEKVYIDTKNFGWLIKKECPQKIRKTIERKKKLLDEQMGENYSRKMR